LILISSFSCFFLHLFASFNYSFSNALEVPFSTSWDRTQPVCTLWARGTMKPASGRRNRSTLQCFLWTAECNQTDKQTNSSVFLYFVCTVPIRAMLAALLLLLCDSFSDFMISNFTHWSILTLSINLILYDVLLGCDAPKTRRQIPKYCHFSPEDGVSMFLRNFLSTYESTRRHNPEEHRHSQSHENLKSHNFLLIFSFLHFIDIFIFLTFLPCSWFVFT
jgi:hypothetical protein